MVYYKKKNYNKGQLILQLNILSIYPLPFAQRNKHRKSICNARMIMAIVKFPIL